MREQANAQSALALHAIELRVAGIIQGPGQFNFDISILKTTRILENHTLQFRAEFFNAFNHPQFNNPMVSVTNAVFGQITSTVVNPRLIQFALKYVF